MYDPRGRMLSEEPEESLERKRRTALMLGTVIIVIGAVPLVLAKDMLTAVLGFAFVLGLGAFVMYWSRMASPTRVYEGGIEFFSGLGRRFVPYNEMGNYYEHNGLVLHYYPEVRMGSSTSTQYRIHLPTSMPNYHWTVSYVKGMVDQNPNARGTKVYVGTGPMRFRVK